MLSCQNTVRLPDELREKISSSIPMTNGDFESRGHNRISALAEGLLQITSSPKVLGEIKNYLTEDASGVVIKDISRSGIGFYCHEQLFPMQVVNIVFQNRLISASIVRCRFIAENCYEIGAVVQSVRAANSANCSYSE